MIEFSFRKSTTTHEVPAAEGLELQRAKPTLRSRLPFFRGRPGFRVEVTRGESGQEPDQPTR